MFSLPYRCEEPRIYDVFLSRAKALIWSRRTKAKEASESFCFTEKS